MPEVMIDKEALRRIVTGMPKAGEQLEWCVACGASAQASKLAYPEQLAGEMAKQFVDPKALREFVTSLRAEAEADWCVACGAGATSSALGRIRPEEISDQFIDQLAGQLIGAVKLS